MAHEHIYMGAGAGAGAGAGPACGEQAIFLPAPAVHMEWSSISKEGRSPA